MTKEITDFGAIRATDKMLDDIWLNSFLYAHGIFGKLFVDMKSENDELKWKVYKGKLNGH